MAPSITSSEAVHSVSPKFSIGKRVAAGVATTALLIGAGLLGNAPASADPGDTIASVNAKLATLSQQTEQATEQYNAAQIDVDVKAAAATAAQADADTAKANYETARTRLNGSIVDQYTSSAFSRTAALLQSQSGQAYLDQLETLNLLNARRTADLEQLQAAKTASDTAQSQATALLADATAQRDSLKKQKDDLDGEQAKYKAELDQMTAAQRAAFYAAQDTAVTPTGQTVAAPAETAPIATPASASGAAATAVSVALAQRGKPYVYAASGPNSFDCSGLTAYAWAAAGVSLPHNAAAQINYGSRVSLDALQPGDLVFYYSPISHVAMYIGDGMVVHAPTSGDVVKVVSVYASGQPVGASRPG